MKTEFGGNHIKNFKYIYHCVCMLLVSCGQQLLQDELALIGNSDYLIFSEVSGNGNTQPSPFEGTSNPHILMREYDFLKEIDLDSVECAPLINDVDSNQPQANNANPITEVQRREFRPPLTRLRYHRSGFQLHLMLLDDCARTYYVMEHEDITGEYDVHDLHYQGLFRLSRFSYFYNRSIQTFYTGARALRNIVGHCAKAIPGDSFYQIYFYRGNNEITVRLVKSNIPEPPKGENYEVPMYEWVISHSVSVPNLLQSPMLTLENFGPEGFSAGILSGEIINHDQMNIYFEGATGTRNITLENCRFSSDLLP